MPGKSRRGRFRRLPPSKKKKDKRHSLAIATQQQPISQVSKPVSRPDVAAPSVGVPTLVAIPTTQRYPYIVAELRRVGILAGILLVILVVLAFVLS